MRDYTRFLKIQKKWDPYLKIQAQGDEDLYQEFLYKLCKIDWREYTFNFNLLKKILENVKKDYIRKHIKKELNFSDLAAESLYDPLYNQTIEEILLPMEISDKLKTILKYKYEGYTNKEVALELKCNEKTIRKLLKTLRHNYKIK